MSLVWLFSGRRTCPSVGHLPAVGPHAWPRCQLVWKPIRGTRQGTPCQGPRRTPPELHAVLRPTKQLHQLPKQRQAGCPLLHHAAGLGVPAGARRTHIQLRRRLLGCGSELAVHRCPPASPPRSHHSTPVPPGVEAEAVEFRWSLVRRAHRCRQVVCWRPSRGPEADDACAARHQ